MPGTGHAQFEVWSNICLQNCLFRTLVFHLITMNHLPTLIAIAFGGSMIAQSEYCGVGTVWDSSSQTCVIADIFEPMDTNLDGFIGIEDLMNLLAHFGDEDLDFDGVYDSVDDCVGEWDECGICNGSGEPCECGNPIEFDNYQYQTVLIGNQCWFAENLRTTIYTNGDSVPEAVGVEFGDIGNVNQEGARTLYGMDGASCSGWDELIDACDATSALTTYGRLYNFYVVQDPRGICQLAGTSRVIMIG